MFDLLSNDPPHDSPPSLHFSHVFQSHSKWFYHKCKKCVVNSVNFSFSPSQGPVYLIWKNMHFAALVVQFWTSNAKIIIIFLPFSLLIIDTVFENYSKGQILIIQIFNFGILQQFLSFQNFPVWPITEGFSKTRQNWPFLAFLMNFCPLKM